MLPYELTAPAEEDLREIARYTLEQWRQRQALRYAGLLDKHLREIAARTVPSRSFSERYPQVRVSRCEHHYIFYIHPEEKPPRIIAVLHERMETLTRLKSRLG
ncbi:MULTISPECIES: type II toxin-antitoxin system RelE/ParE family toxin [unclassified Methylocaldum]|jgi:plasmid stabilization system protein ParE|uniref:type II toxin-antitoxin system RelE/ParE family toxin n=1 Tax=unclassified Methylocaldum TaxID=2622260 RepID=UPI00098B0291|nr:MULTISPECIES: type II toxin-antitoxin system RelE/ParE family toxin [unclassified Methylocaldum]MBP1149524.1 plasmid stabilization system protein ParE [Methylocaldum sp. RMAD-M]